MTRAEREALSQRICNFYHDSANKCVKTTVNYFKKQNIPRSTIHYILKKYLRYGTTKDRSRSGRPVKLSDKNLSDLVESVNNRCGLSQRKMGRKFRVHHTTISRNLRKRTSIVIRRRRTAPKMNNEQQEIRAKKNCGKLYRKLLNGYDLIIDDEKYFKLSGDNVLGNRFFYSTDPSTTPSNVKFIKKKKFDSKVMIWMAISSRGVSNVYVHRSKQGVRQETYLKECIKKRLLPFIAKYHSNGNYLFWPDLAKAHYSNIVQDHLKEKNIRYVSSIDNPPNVPQARPIELIWTVLERKIYENNWEAQDIDHLVQRIKRKAKELDQQMLQGMIEGVRKKLRVLWRNGLYSIL